MKWGCTSITARTSASQRRRLRRPRKVKVWLAISGIHTVANILCSLHCVYQVLRWRWMSDHKSLSWSRFVLDIGMSQDWLALQIALAPCLIGYGEIAKRLYADPKTKREGNIYWKWIENYVADDYVEAVMVGSGEWNFMVLWYRFTNAWKACSRRTLSYSHRVASKSWWKYSFTLQR